MKRPQAALGAALLCLALAAPAAAQEKPAHAHANPSAEHSAARAADLKLLDALLKRRAEIAGSANPQALAFLDKHIAELKTRLSK